MTKAAAIQLLLDIEERKVPPEKVGPTIGVVCRILRELLNGTLT